MSHKILDPKSNTIAISLAERLFSMHIHAEALADGDPNLKVYKETDVIELLLDLGHPLPDFKGYGRQAEIELLTGPWDTVRAWIEEHSIEELATKLGMPTDALQSALDKAIPLDHDLILGLEKATGIPFLYWKNREAQYRAKLNDNDPV